MKERFWQFDYLKALCAVSVIFIHNWMTGYNQFSIIYPFFITLAVPIFVLINGYFGSKTIEENGNTIKAWYKKKVFIKKILNILSAYTIIYILECLYLIFKGDMSPTDYKYILSAFVRGGIGPGGYFIPVIIQAIILFPFIHYLLKKNILMGIGTCVAIQMILEIAAAIGYIPADVYRLCYYRFLVFSVGGIVLYVMRDRINYKLITLLSLISIGYIIIVNYTNINISLFLGWKTTAMPVIFWIIAIVSMFLIYLKKIPSFFHKIMCTIGKASFYIFLVQKLYYSVLRENFWSDIKILSLLINLIICIALGTGYYMLCSILTRKVILLIKQMKHLYFMKRRGV